MKTIKDGHLIKLRSPVSLNIDLTSQCNWRCKFCYVEGNNKPIKSKDFSPYEIFKEMIDKIADAGVFKINLFGGEPMLNPDFLKIAEYAENKNLDVGMVSNGSLINEGMAEKIKEYMEGCSLSIHGLEMVHDYLTGVRGSYKKSIESIRFLTSANVKTGICYTLVNNNKEELDKFCDSVLEQYPISYFALGRFIQTGRGYRNKTNLETTKEEFNEALGVIKQKKNKYEKVSFTISDSIPYCLVDDNYKELANSCSAGITFAALDEKGNLKLCSGSPYILGNIFEENIETIWQESKLMNYYRDRKSVV